MAQRRVVRVVDDVTGAEGARTHRLRWDGREVEIDLTDKNAADLDEVLQPYLDAGRPVQPARPASASTSARRRGRDDLSAVREWARAHGHQVSDRGRVPKHVLDAYAARA